MSGGQTKLAAPGEGTKLAYPERAPDWHIRRWNQTGLSGEGTRLACQEMEPDWYVRRGDQIGMSGKGTVVHVYESPCLYLRFSWILSMEWRSRDITQVDLWSL